MKRKSILFLILAVFIGCPTVSPLDDGAQLKQSEFLYESLTGNKPTPPANITVTAAPSGDNEKGDFPVISWSPDKNAVAYKVYRRKEGEKEYKLIANVSTCDYYSDTINGRHDSGTYYYAVTSVDMFGRESFFPNAILFNLVSPENRLKTELIAVSQGGFQDVKDNNNQTVVYSNKLGVLLTFRANPEIYAYRIQVQEKGAAGWSNAEFAYKPPMNPISVPGQDGAQYYYMHTPARQGVKYEYRILPVNKDGILGEASNVLDGFVYPPAVAGKIVTDVGVCCIPVTVSGETGGIIPEYVVQWAENESGPFQAIDKGNVNWESGEVALTENGLKSILENLGPDVYVGNVYIRVMAKYAVSGTSQIYETVPCEAQLVNLIKSGADILPFPSDVSISNGIYDGTTMTTPVVITWTGSTGAANLKGYRVYRTNQLFFSDENKDKGTTWTFLQFISKESGPSYRFEDNLIDRIGGYIYKINPTSDSSSDTGSDNNSSLDSFAYAAVFGKTAPVLSAQNQNENFDNIQLTWEDTSSSDISGYRLYVSKPKDIDTENFSEYSGLRVGSSFTYPADRTPGQFRFKIAPVIEIQTVDGKKIKEFQGAFSNVAEGAIALSNEDWIRLVMNTIEYGQSLIKRPADTQTVTEGKISYTRRKTVFSKADYDHVFQAFNFSGYEDSNKAISIEGCLYHLYLGEGGLSNKTDEGFCLSFSSQTSFTTDDDSDTGDKKNKTPESLNVGGIYPGTIQIWGKNNIAPIYQTESEMMKYIDLPNGGIGIYLIGDYSDWAAFAELDYLSNWGFKTIAEKSVKFETGKAYNINRNGVAGSYSFSEIGRNR